MHDDKAARSRRSRNAFEGKLSDLIAPVMHAFCVFNRVRWSAPWRPAPCARHDDR